jgi:hypothetical protein
MAVRLLTKHEVAERLAPFGCELLEEIVNPADEFYAFSYWRTAWGFHFTVPLVGPDQLCPEPHLFEILSQLSAQSYERQP